MQDGMKATHIHSGWDWSPVLNFNGHTAVLHKRHIAYLTHIVGKIRLVAMLLMVNHGSTRLIEHQQPAPFSSLHSTLLTLPTSEWWPLDIQDKAITAASISLVFRPACWLTVSPSYAQHPHLRDTQWNRRLLKRLNEVGQLG